jgi:hypothetical protein
VFTSFNLHERLLKAVTELGFTEPTPVQLVAIPDRQWQNGSVCAADVARLDARPQTAHSHPRADFVAHA